MRPAVRQSQIQSLFALSFYLSQERLYSSRDELLVCPQSGVTVLRNITYRVEEGNHSRLATLEFDVADTLHQNGYSYRILCTSRDRQNVEYIMTILSIEYTTLYTEYTIFNLLY